MHKKRVSRRIQSLEDNSKALNKNNKLKLLGNKSFKKMFGFTFI